LGITEKQKVSGKMWRVKRKGQKGSRWTGMGGEKSKDKPRTWYTRGWEGY